MFLVYLVYKITVRLNGGQYHISAAVHGYDHACRGDITDNACTVPIYSGPADALTYLDVVEESHGLEG